MLQVEVHLIKDVASVLNYLGKFHLQLQHDHKDQISEWMPFLFEHPKANRKIL